MGSNLLVVANHPRITEQTFWSDALSTISKWQLTKNKQVWNETSEETQLVQSSQKTLLSRGMNSPQQPKKSIWSRCPLTAVTLSTRGKGTSFASASTGTSGTNLEASFDHVGAQGTCFNHSLIKWRMGHSEEDMVLYQTGAVNIPETKSFHFPFL